MGFGWLLICSFYKWMNLVTESLHLWGQFLFTNRSFFFPGCTEKQTFIKRHCISITWSPCGYLFQVVVTHSLTRDVFFFSCSFYVEWCTHLLPLIMVYLHIFNEYFHYFLQSVYQKVNCLVLYTWLLKH